MAPIRNQRSNRWASPQRPSTSRGITIAWTIRLEPGPGKAVAIRYERHEPENTLLHRVVRDDVESFLSRSRSAGAPVARFVEREIRAYLECEAKDLALPRTPLPIDRTP